MTIDSSKAKVFADDNFIYDNNGGKFSERVKDNAGKGQIACYKKFLLFPRCFLNICTADTKKKGLVWERVSFLFERVESMVRK